MSLFDILFPQYAVPTHLHAMRNLQEEMMRTQAAAQKTQTLRETTMLDALKMRIDDLEHDLGFVVLALASLLTALDETGTLTRDEVRSKLDAMDQLDGLRDGRVNIRALKQWIANEKDPPA